MQLWGIWEGGGGERDAMLREEQGSGYVVMEHTVGREGHKEVVMRFRRIGKG